MESVISKEFFLDIDVKSLVLVKILKQTSLWSNSGI